ncbi:MAG TPA: DNA-directed RNA polymerase subunit alpha C-terminal domain-containing protein, partial [bacterium]|nr:DNA-directed RNA polymerase subunit alpha C-terminal domain-containing protein [bacterium]
VIFNVDGATTVFLEADVRKGRGYEPIEKREAEDYPIGYIPVDAIFSPIRRVNYRVENTRVGRRTDYEKLIMEIWTDGSLMPEDALGYSASVLKNSLNVFIEFEKKGPSVDEIPSLSAGHEPQGLKDLLEQPIDVIELSVRALNCLRQAKINYIKDLITKDETKLLSYKNFGQKSLEEIKEKLAELAKARGIEISLGMKA